MRIQNSFRNVEFSKINGSSEDGNRDEKQACLSFDPRTLSRENHSKRKQVLGSMEQEPVHSMVLEQVLGSMGQELVLVHSKVLVLVLGSMGQELVLVLSSMVLERVLVLGSMALELVRGSMAPEQVQVLGSMALVPVHNMVQGHSKALVLGT